MGNISTDEEIQGNVEDTTPHIDQKTTSNFIDPDEQALIMTGEELGYVWQLLDSDDASCKLFSLSTVCFLPAKQSRLGK